MNAWTKVKGLFFPRDLRCALCGQELTKVERGCCEKCDKELAWESVRRELPGLDQVFCAATYAGAVRELILRFKYKNDRYLARLFAHQMAAFLFDQEALLLPVPMHPIRRRERGFCQTTELCRELSMITGLKTAPKALRRLRNTASQTQLDSAARQKNIKGAFHADLKWVEGRECVLVDDVVSTGATLSECAFALREAGAIRVIGWTIAT